MKRREFLKGASLGFAAAALPSAAQAGDETGQDLRSEENCQVSSLLARPEAVRPQEKEETLWQPYYIWPRTGEQHQLLDGDWEMGYLDTPIVSPQDLQPQSKWIRVQVPNSVQWALYESGELPHPYLHLNSRLYAWVPEKVWYYRRQFQVPALPETGYVFLCFDAAGYYLRVWLNGTLLGRNEGMFGGPEIEVRKYLRPGSNEILVEVKAGSYGVKNWDAWNTGKVVLPWGVAGGPKPVTPEGISFKEFEPFGIWRSVRLEFVPQIHLERPFLVTEAAGDREARLKLKAEVFVNTQSLDFQLHAWNRHLGIHFRNSWTSRRVETPVTLNVEISEKGSTRPALRQSFPLQLFEGRNFVEQDLRVASPRLWWPNGLGEPNLYRVKVELAVGGASMDHLEFDYGIRVILHEPSAGPRMEDRWANWQFVVNGRKFFLKGMNWAWPLDVLYYLPHWRYRWMLKAAHAAGVQMIRVWGGGNPETEDFYELCDEMGIMVWEDFPLANQEAALYPLDVWEAQVFHTLFRVRNHQSLAVWCGGNEFNPYDPSNTAVTGVTERTVRDFDGTRFFTRTTPDPGDVHIYEDMDPTWYAHLYHWVPFVSETSMHNIPEAQSIRAVVDARELQGPISDIFSHKFWLAHPEFYHHFQEPGGARAVWERGTQIDDLAAPSLDTFCEALQVACAEFTKIYSEQLQANYPLTTGLMPWSLTVPWPLVYHMFIDGLDQPTPAYYFLKRTYEPVHVMLRLPHLLWAPGERFPATATVLNGPETAMGGLKLSVTAFDTDFRALWSQERSVELKRGVPVTDFDLGSFTLPARLEDKFFIVVAELKRGTGEIVSRSNYWPRCLKKMADPAFRAKYRSGPQPSLVFDRGPWLKKEITTSPARTALRLDLISIRDQSRNHSHIGLRVRNSGSHPAFLTQLGVEGTQRAFLGADNWFWLASGEERSLEFEILWHDPATRANASLTAAAWNANKVRLPLATQAAQHAAP
ncbi:MAG: beta-mannosidase [Acidobacteria bacterium]|nr:beta-mannosidase [Acidobacteriota bacterium]